MTLQTVFFGLLTANPTLKNRLWEDIVARYSEPGRYYHTMEHLQNMYRHLQAIFMHIDKKEEVLFALFYHDIIYDPLRKDNETQSASYAEEILTKLGSPADKITTVAQLIEATAGHKFHQQSDVNYFLDADLSILASIPENYDEYAANVRKEYGIYPDNEYRQGRKQVLLSFLSSERIFKTDYFFEQSEAQARKNIARELAGL